MLSAIWKEEESLKKIIVSMLSATASLTAFAGGAVTWPDGPLARLKAETRDDCLAVAGGLLDKMPAVFVNDQAVLSVDDLEARCKAGAVIAFRPAAPAFVRTVVKDGTLVVETYWVTQQVCRAMVTDALKQAKSGQPITVMTVNDVPVSRTESGVDSACKGTKLRVAIGYTAITK